MTSRPLASAATPAAAAVLAAVARRRHADGLSRDAEDPGRRHLPRRHRHRRYRWLEDDNAPDVKRVGRRAERADAPLSRRASRSGRRSPSASAQLLHAEPVQRYDFQYREQLFAIKHAAAARTSRCWSCCRPTATSRSERVVLDPERARPNGPHDDRLLQAVATTASASIVSLSKNGSEEGTAYVYDVATGKRLPTSFRGVQYPTGRRQRRMGAGRHAASTTRAIRRATSGRRRTAISTSRSGSTRSARRSATDRYVIGTRLSAHRRDRASRQPRRPLPARRGAQRRRRRDRLPPARARRPLDAGRRVHRRRQAGRRSARTATSTR